MIYGIDESMLLLKLLFSPLLGLSLTILILVFALLKPWVPLKSMLLSMRVKVTNIGRLVRSSLFNIFDSLSRALHDCGIFDSHIFFANQKSLYVGLMLLPCKSKETNLSALLKILSVNYRVHLLPVDILIFFYSCQQYEYAGKCLPPAELC